ncbi:MAG: pectinesterase [Chloroflexi bacterium]|nr:pectinesterase [Chloroflexota bacterium]
MKRLLLLFLFIGLTVACQSAVVIEETAVPPPPTPAPAITPTPTQIPTENATAPAQIPANAVPAPPHATVAVANNGPDFASLNPGWTKVEPGGDTRCAHDTDFAYWVKPGTVDKLLIYFEGGGGCWDADSCRLGSTFYDPDVGSDEDPAFRSGILDFDNPDNPFAEYNAVYIPSCNGDVYWGNSVQEYPDANGETLTIYHRGFVNASAALDWAYRNVTQPESVFVTGCSAGSVGSRVLAPYIIENYQASTVTQLGDSLSFVFGRPVRIDSTYGTYNTFPTWIPALANLAQSDALLMADYDAIIANHYPNNTFAQYNTENDNVQVRFYTANGAPADGFRADLAAHLSSVHLEAPNFRSYTASGDLHCILPRSQFYSQEANGVRLVDWVQALANGTAVNSVQCETCAVNTAGGEE